MEEAIVFGVEHDAKLTFALAHFAAMTEMPAHYRPQEGTIIFTAQVARRWSESDLVGIHRNCALRGEALAVLIEKDCSCFEQKRLRQRRRLRKPKSREVLLSELILKISTSA